MQLDVGAFSGLLVASMMLGVMPAKAQSTIIFSDLTGTATPGGYIVGQYSPGNSYVIGAAFTPSQDYQLSQFQGLLSFSSGVNEMIIGLYDDSGGVPGTLLESWDLIDALFTAPTIIMLNSVLSPTLTEGHQYWITARMASPTSEGVWWINDIGGLCCGEPGEVQGIAASSLNGGPFTSGALTTLGFNAFSVSGMPCSVSGPSGPCVPTPVKSVLTTTLTANGDGVVTVDQTTGAVTYCTSNVTVTGTTATPTGACVLLGRATPGSGTTSLSVTASSSSVFILNNQTGAILQCATLTQLVGNVLKPLGSCVPQGPSNK